jgi:hypothetical protein
MPLYRVLLLKILEGLFDPIIIDINAIDFINHLRHIGFNITYHSLYTALEEPLHMVVLD